ncbi:LytR/AlgR family response regulator transcription factor [Echinicola shivajiensis]|uniref:LytR/AlgR family response regulator transcription factor n=1 Tax=Echinicola shivajiensis TaxID=1035916 RepID=UPI001BFCB132|nr:LytTR family DNA-binding domain-containing protein [Echinicola shivajiensis]
MIDFKTRFFQTFPILEKPWERLLLIGFCAVFSILFINIYTPFNINHWANDSGLNQFFRLSAFGIIGGLFLVISQFILRPITLKNQWTLGIFGIWFLLEILLLSLVFFLIYGNHYNSIGIEYLQSIKYTFLGLLIPYLLAIAVILIIKQQQKIQTVQAPKTEIIQLKDEYGQNKLSIKPQYILFLESADNYVTIHYLDNKTVKKEMLRNTLKSLEEQLSPYGIKRCHRSYLVNIQQIKMAKKTSGKNLLYLEGTSSILPISRKYLPEFKSF